MNKVLKTVLFLVVLLVVMMSSACTLSASKAPTTKATPTGELNFLTPTTVAGGVATQTAVAKPQVATATPKAAAPTTPPKSVSQPTAVPQQQSSASIPTLARPSTYTLQKGEFPICIARRFDLDLATLFSQNGMNMSSRPSTGAVLKISSSGNWNSANYGSRQLRKHVDYKVGASDSVYSIACYFGDVSPEGILAANSLSNASDVKSGMTLKIP
jgi:hypothetical protein